MADESGRRADEGRPLVSEGDVFIPPGDMRVGHPPQCAQIDENARKSMDFLNAMDPKDAEKCMGEWIAVAGGGIVAHGRDTGQACDAAWEAGRGAPHTRYICARPEEAARLFGGLCVPPMHGQAAPGGPAC